MDISMWESEYKVGCRCPKCKQYRKNKRDNGMYTYNWETTNKNLPNTIFKDNQEKFVIIGQNGTIFKSYAKEKEAVKEIGKLLMNDSGNTYYIYEAVASFSAKTPEMEREEL